MQFGVLTNDSQAVVQELYGVIDGVLTPPERRLSRLQIAFVRMKVADGTRSKLLVFNSCQLKLKGTDNGAGEALLDREDVLDGSVVLSGPQVIVSARIDQPRRDP